MKKTALYSLFFLLGISLRAQQGGQAFLSRFQKAGPQEKVRLTATREFSEIAPLYVFLKDTLNEIRRKANLAAQPSHLKFLFDKLDANRETYHKNYARAIIIYENSLRDHAADVNDSLRCLVGLKNLFAKIRNYNRAIELNHMIELKWPHRTDTAPMYYGIAKSTIYKQIGLIEKAITERRKEFNSNKNKRDALVIAGYCNDVGVFYNLLKNSDSAKVYFLKAKQVLANLHYPDKGEGAVSFFKALVDGNMGLAYFNSGKLQEAIPLLKNDIYYSLHSNNFESAFNSYLLLVKLQLDLKSNRLAGLYLDSACRLIATKIKDPNPRLKLLLTQANYYNRIGNFSRANENYREYLDLTEKTTAIENAQRLQNEKVSISLEQREIELGERDNMLKLMQLNEAKDRSFKAYLLAGVLLLLAIMSFLILNNYNSKKREAQLFTKNRQISRQKFQIEQSLKDKDVLIKEIHHRVKNNLQIITSMLSLQISKLEDAKTESILRDAKQRISSIALTHQMLYQKENLSTVNLGEYLERLVRQIEHIMPLSNIQLVTEIQSNTSRLTIDNAVPLGLLVNELLTNAYKHAFPEGEKGRIVVKLTEDENSFTVEVVDNGIGLPDNFDTVERKTLGMELIYILAEQLGSALIIENANGSSFKLNVKKA